MHLCISLQMCWEVKNGKEINKEKRGGYKGARGIKKRKGYVIKILKKSFITEFQSTSNTSNVNNSQTYMILSVWCYKKASGIFTPQQTVN